MADSDKDPAGEATPAGGAAGDPPEMARPVSKTPRVSPPTVAQRREESAGISGVKVNLEDLITWLRDGSKPGPAESQPSTLSKEKRKFRRYDPPPARAAESAAESTLEPSVAEPAPEGTPSPASEAALPPGGSRAKEGPALATFVPKSSRRAAAAPRSGWSNLGVQAGAVVLMALCFFLGRSTMPVTAAAPDKRPAPALRGADPAVLTLSDATLSVIDQAVEVENAGDMKKAAALFDQLKNGPEHVNGLDYQIGWIGYRTGNLAAATLALNRSIAEGEYVSDCYGLRALMMSRLGPTKSLRDFESASRASPFEAASFFQWGEILRRAGKPREALVRLREAVQRASSPDDVAEYQLKVRLTQIELGQEKEFGDPLAAELASPRPPLEWVLTAAAEDMHNGNYAAAASDLDRARQTANSARLASELGDYFFAGYAEKDPLRRIYAEISPSAATSPAPAGSPGATTVPAGSMASATTPLAAPESASPVPAGTP